MLRRAPLGAVTLYPKVFWDGTGFIEAEKNPVKAADAVFGGLKAPTGVNPDVEAREALLKLTEGEVQGLQQELSLAQLGTKQTASSPRRTARVARQRQRWQWRAQLHCSTSPCRT